jgi:hypothetical protein
MKLRSCCVGRSFYFFLGEMDEWGSIHAVQETVILYFLKRARNPCARFAARPLSDHRFVSCFPKLNFGGDLLASCEGGDRFGMGLLYEKVLVGVVGASLFSFYYKYVLGWEGIVSVRQAGKQAGDGWHGKEKFGLGAWGGAAYGTCRGKVSRKSHESFKDGVLGARKLTT